MVQTDQPQIICHINSPAQDFFCEDIVPLKQKASKICSSAPHSKIYVNSVLTVQCLFLHLHSHILYMRNSV